MDLNYVNIMLYATGILTTSIVLLFFAPELVLDKMFKITIKDEASLFIARHWGLLVGIFGLLIICSAHNPEIRSTILIAAVIEKAAIVLMILKNFNKEFTKGLRGIVVVDTTTVVLYLLYLTGIT